MAGVPFNAMVTARARGATDAEGKALVRKLVFRIGRKFGENGHELIGVIVYEREPGTVHLHAHVLLHVPPRAWKLIEAFNRADGEVHVRRADADAIEYVTKQRQWLGPAAEKAIGRRWIASARIEGPRYTPTTAAKALLAREGAAQPAAPVPAPVQPAAGAPTIEAQPIAAVVETPAVRTVAIETAAIPSMTNAPAYQLALALDQPAQPRAPDDEWVHHERAARGLTQAEFGALGGIRQPHVANVERAHDRLRYRTRREIAYRLSLLDQGRMAA
ncbi:helix-turn-helix transcriptional regulator [Salinarimonas rosea]|uniref:helix-turn-helix transcriptional regulator n=1 Tax=Salinarimonas rosea TaxID=552063 RepID=UPI00040AD41C|nr:helix-turn-helix transcriptional regulator [Salinarimonas rosea]